MTDTGKNTVAEVAHFIHKSSAYILFPGLFVNIFVNKLIDIMEDDDDVQNIWHNWEE